MIISTLESHCRRISEVEGYTPRVLGGSDAPTVPPSEINEDAEDTAPAVYIQDETENDTWVWDVAQQEWKLASTPTFDLPWQVLGETQSAKSGESVSGTDVIYRSGKTIIGGNDGVTTQSDGGNLEVRGSLVTGKGNHTISGLHASVLGGDGNTATGEAAIVSGSICTASGDWSVCLGGISNYANEIHAVCIGGATNGAQGIQSAVIGGSGNLATDYDAAVIAGRNCTNNGQRSLVSGEDVTNDGNWAAIFGVQNDNLEGGDATLMAGSLNSNASVGSIIAGTGNVVTASGDSSIVAGFNNPNVDTSRSVVCGDNNDVSGSGNLIGGIDHVGTGLQKTLVFGVGNTVTSTTAGVIGGELNDVTGSARSAVFGYQCSLTNALSNLVNGVGHEVTANNCMVGGTGNTVGAAIPVTGTSDCLAVGNGLTVADGVFNGWVGGVNTQLLHNNSWIYSAEAAASTPTIATQSFTFHGAGGARFLSNAAGTVGVSLASGAAAWAAVSQRKLKERIDEVEDALDAIENLGIYEYSYKGQALRQLGPMADGADGWHKNVGTGEKDKVSSHDMAALALAGIKELTARLSHLL